MKFRKRFFFFAITFIIAASFCLIKGTVSLAQSLEGFIVEGESLDSIIIGKSTMDDVVSVYGTDYKLIKHNEYSNEMVYTKLGLSFYSCQNDPNKEIFSISIQSPFKVTTRKGIILGESNFADVLRIFGKSERNYAFKGIAFFNDEINYKEKIAKSEEEVVKKNTVIENPVSENLPKTFVIDEEEFIIDGLEVSETRTGSLNPSNSLNKEETSENQEDEELAGKDSENNKIVKRIDLFEKADIARQCHVKFRK
ncbi:MAG TPA: hypothetical protein PKY59_19780 [Pyrinomonadaceae bacterium]|nr:hypothetical protein [Pyrinomonadaceae bacterium]